MDDVESYRIVELEQGENGRQASTRDVGGTSDQTSFIGGRHRHITTVYDNSYNDSSNHHYGDVNVITTNYHGGQASVDMRLNRARDLLLAHVSHGALHDSAERGPEAPKCYPETRVAVQQEIFSWIKSGRHDSSPKKILWLSGPAGSGKTAIAGSIADQFHKEDLLAASFFFSAFGGSADRCSKRPLIATLVYQLIRHNSMHLLRDEVLAELERDPLILNRNLDAQADTLLLNPLRKVSSRLDARCWPLLILIDGLDECTGERGDDKSAQSSRQSQGDAQREILSILVRLSRDPSIPFHIFIISRPEQAIKRFFSFLPDESLTEIFLNANYNPTADIRLFIGAMLHKIGRDYRLQEDWYTHVLPIDWPASRTRDVPLYLAQEASEQFIYAATVIRYVQDGTSAPTEQLRRIVSSRGQAGSNPFSALDALYTMILQASPTPLLSATWIVAIRNLSDVGPRGVWYFKALFESSPGETEVRLGNLASLVGVPSNEEKPFTFYHKSLFDFLDQPERSGELHVGTRGLGSFLDDRHYQVLKNRGPQIPMRNDQSLNRFIDAFCNDRFWCYSPDFVYDASDVDWWCSHTDTDTDSERSRYIQIIFEHMHSECMWYHCSTSCKVWRKGILQHVKTKTKGWRMPTWTELLQDRFKKVEVISDDFPLRPLPTDGGADNGAAGSRSEDFLL